jgi:hypothetical protein
METLRNSCYHVNLNAMILTKNLSSAKKLVKQFSDTLKTAKFNITNNTPEKGFHIEIYFEKDLDTLKESLKLIKKLNKVPFKIITTQFNISFSYSDGVVL